MKKLNSIGFGIFSGFLLPVVIYLLLYYSRVKEIRFTLFSDPGLLSSVLPVLISHCIIPNMILFFVFNWADRLLSAKGVVIATVVLTAGVFAIKLITSII
jgi:hypothetical protein